MDEIRTLVFTRLTTEPQTLTPNCTPQVAFFTQPAASNQATDLYYQLGQAVGQAIRNALAGSGVSLSSGPYTTSAAGATSGGTSTKTALAVALAAVAASGSSTLSIVSAESTGAANGDSESPSPGSAGGALAAWGFLERSTEGSADVLAGDPTGVDGATAAEADGSVAADSVAAAGDGDGDGGSGGGIGADPGILPANPGALGAGRSSGGSGGFFIVPTPVPLPIPVGTVAPVLPIGLPTIPVPTAPKGLDCPPCLGMRLQKLESVAQGNVL